MAPKAEWKLTNVLKMEKIKLIIAGFIFCSLLVNCKSRTVGVTNEKSLQDIHVERRSIQILSNVSCTELTRRYAVQNLTDDELMEVLEQKGGEYLTDYMAKNKEEARKKFRPLNKPHRRPGSKTEPIQPTDQPLKERLPSPPRSPRPGEKPQRPPSPSRSPKPGEGGTPDPTDIKYLMKFLQQARKHQKNCDSTLYSDKNYLRPSVVGLGRKKRQSGSDSVTTNGSCVFRGTRSDDGFLQMCTTCSTTTTLSDSHFPRVLNEVSCGDNSTSSTDSTGCLFVSGTANGQCKQQYIYVNMLRKTGKCSLVTDSGSNAVAVDEWELYTQPIRVSCECMVDERSFFSSFVTT